MLKGSELSLIGIVLIIIGLTLLILGRVNLPFVGRLPGDIQVHREGFSFYFPWVTFLLLSIVLTIIINLIWRFFGR